MRPKRAWARRLRIVAAAGAAAAGFSSAAFASIALDPDSSAKITHDPDINSTSDSSQHKNVLPVPDSGAMYPNVASYSYGSKTVSLTSGSNTASSTAAGSVGAITNAANVGFTLASGTGITQNDPSGKVFKGSAELKFQVDGIWDIGTGGYGPGYGYVAFTVGTNVPTGGSASVQVDLDWTDASSHATLRSGYTNTVTFAPGSTTKTISNAAVLISGEAGNLFSKNRQIEVSGTITFLARDPCDPVTIQPVDFEMSSTPPVWRFNPPGGVSTLNFSSGGNWINEMGTFEASSIPNQPGARAQFEGTAAPAGPVLVTQPVTLGMLDIDQPGVNLLSFGNSPLIFNTVGPNAVLLARDVHDTTTAGHSINSPILLQRTTEVTNDAAGALVLSGAISGTGGIEKNGNGEVVLGSTGNSYTGPTNINAGALTITGNLPASGLTTVNTGGVLAGSGNGSSNGLAGNVMLKGGSIHPGAKAADGTTGTLTFNTLTIQSGDLRMDVGAASDRIIASTATITGPTTVTPVIPDLSTFQPGTYTLLSANALTISPGFAPKLAGVPTTSRLNFSLNTSVPNLILLNVTGSVPKTLRWVGSSNSAWDLNSSQNWRDSALNPEHYFDYDTPTFDDTAANPNVTLNDLVTPRNVNFNNNVNYSLTGNGGMTGSMSLVKTGSGQLLLGLSNSYSGTTSVQQGILQIASSNALSANTTVVLGSAGVGGTLDLHGIDTTVGGLATGAASSGNGITNNSPASAVLTFAGGSSTFGGLLLDGTSLLSLHVAKGTLILTGNNTNNGTTNIDSVSTDNQDDPGTVSDGIATLQIGNGGTTGSLGAGAIIDNGALVFNRSDNINVFNSISGSGTVIKSGTGTLALFGNNSFAGLTVQSGVLAFATDAPLGAATAPVTLDGGTLVVYSATVSQRPIYLGMSGGTIDAQAASQFDNVSGCGTLTKLGVGTLFTNSLSSEGLNVNAGAIVILQGRQAIAKHSYVEHLNITNGTTLDLGDNDLIFDYDNNGVADPAKTAQVMALIVSGFNGGVWNGTGLTSSAARSIAGNSAMPYKTALGYAEAGKTGLGSFDGIPVDGDMLLIRYTLQGDANLDGTVNALDFNALASAFGSANPHWVNGDFDYNGNVNTGDFVSLSKNFGQSLGDSPLGPGALVPEPVIVAWGFLALTGFNLRTRRVKIEK